MLAPGGQLEDFRGFGRKAENPFGEASRIEQLARMVDTVGKFRIRIARVFGVKPRNRGLEKWRERAHLGAADAAGLGSAR
jgi:hypothetical protein